MEAFVDALVDTLEFFPKGLIYVVVGLVALLVAKVAQDLITRYSISQQVTGENNAALGLSMAGYYLGVVLVFVGALYQPLSVVRDEDWAPTSATYWGEVLEVAVYALVGIVVLNAARIVVDRLVLHRFATEKEIVEDRNTGTGAVEFGVYLATGLVIAGSIAGTGSTEAGGTEVGVLDSAVRSLVFLGLGMIVLILYSLFYQLTTSYDIHDEIERDNTAVGVALAGNLIAMGLVTFKAVFGEFVGWPESLAGFLVFAVLGFVLLFTVRQIADIVLLPGAKLQQELSADRNLGVAFVISGRGNQLRADPVFRDLTRSGRQLDTPEFRVGTLCGRHEGIAGSETVVLCGKYPRNQMEMKSGFQHDVLSETRKWLRKKTGKQPDAGPRRRV